MTKADFSVTGVKTFQGMEDTGYNANLLYRGEKVADLVYDGRGGRALVRFLAGCTDLQTRCKAFGLSLPPVDFEGVSIPMSFNLFAECLVHSFLEDRNLRNQCRKAVLCLDAHGRVFKVTGAGNLVTDEIRAWVKNHGAVEIINDRFAKQ